MELVTPDQSCLPNEPELRAEYSPLSLYLNLKTQIQFALEKQLIQEAIKLSAALLRTIFSGKDQAILIRPQE